MTTKIVAQRICTVPGCMSDNRVKVNPQYCLNHHRRWKRYGDPLQFYTSHGDTPAERFWSQVAVTADDSRCWLWTGKTQKKDYPRRKYLGRHHLGHHIAWHLTHGRFPVGEALRHTCDTPRCVNPKHLVEGSYVDNVRDRQERSRQAIGEGIAHAKLTALDIPAIRRALAEGEAAKSIADRYGVYLSTITSIKLGVTWGHIPDSEDCASRYRWGKQAGKKRQSVENVREIKRMLAANHTPLEIAQRFNISRQVVYGIKHEQIWKHVQ